MNEKHKDEFNGAEDKFSELGQQAGALLGQLFSAAEKFGHQVSKETQAWSQSRPTEEPFVSALREAGEEFRATANRAAEGLSDSFRNTEPSDSHENVAESDDIRPGNARRIGGSANGGSAMDSKQPSNEHDSSAIHEQVSADNVAIQRAQQLAEIFRNDRGLSDLTTSEFGALKILLEKQYHAIRDFQGKK